MGALGDDFKTWMLFMRLGATPVMKLEVADNPVFVHFTKFGSSIAGFVSVLPTDRPEPLIWTVGK
ncbi:hypothetical protein HDF11_003260 [Tunturiibacter psychrotolerans]|jgi:hypothetical protein